MVGTAETPTAARERTGIPYPNPMLTIVAMTFRGPKRNTNTVDVLFSIIPKFTPP